MVLIRSLTWLFDGLTYRNHFYLEKVIRCMRRPCFWNIFETKQKSLFIFIFILTGLLAITGLDFNGKAAKFRVSESENLKWGTLHSTIKAVENFMDEEREKLDLGRYNLTGKGVTNVNATESEEMKWGRYYRNLIADLDIKPYKNDFKCNQRFLPSIEENMRLVLNYSVISNMKKKYPEIFNKFSDTVTPADKTFPVLVTAASSKYFFNTVKQIKSAQINLLSKYKDMKLVFYDLGLKRSQREKIKEFCNCEIRTFAFNKYPKFVSVLKNYVWKPLIIYTMLLEYNMVMWADSSIIFQRTNKSETDIFFKRVKDVGIQVSRLPREFRVFMYTKSETFHILNESVCKYEFPIFEAGFTTVLKTSFTWKYVIQPWLACALTENCMSHPIIDAVLYCGSSQRLHKCHRFDQSVLSIILQRHFNVYHEIATFNNLNINLYKIERFV